VPAVRRLLETALYCDNLDDLSLFYERLLGAPAMLRTERLVALDAGEGTVLLLFQRGRSTPLQTDEGLVPGHDGSGPVHLAFAIDEEDVPAWVSRLAECHIAIESRVHWNGGGQSIYFRDPEGRSVELATPGVWPSY
jgi:catechol-2,3-dioxygenase